MIQLQIGSDFRIHRNESRWVSNVALWDKKAVHLKNLNFMNTKIISKVILTFIICVFSIYIYAQNEVNITVTSEQMQEFIGLAFSIHKAKDYFLPSNPTALNRLYKETFSGMNSITFWSYIENPTLRDQLITIAQSYGLKRIIVNTTGEPQTPEEHAINLFSEIKEYMESGYPVYGTTIMNKPNTDESDTKRVDPTFLTTAAKRLRFKLDSAGYDTVKIGGPSTIEWAPYMDPTLGGAAHGYSFVPGDNMNYLEAFLDDTAALNVLDAIDFQSYGWSINNQIQHIADSLGKELWITLAATDGYQNDNGDPILATISAANILANLNHGVSYWSHWVWDQLVNFSTGYPNTRMKYMQQIGRNIRPGAIVHRCLADESQPTVDMFWNYYDFDHPEIYIQPEIVAGAAVNADTTMTIAIVNLSGIHAQHFFSEYHADEAKVYTINLTIEDMAGFSSIPVYPVLCQNDGNISEELEKEIVNGNIELNLASKNMLVLNTGKLVAPPVSSQVYSSINGVSDITVYPNPFRDELMVSADINAGNIHLKIFNIQGQLVYQSNEQYYSGGRFEFKLNLSDLRDGIYICEISVKHQDDLNNYRIKIIKSAL